MKILGHTSLIGNSGYSHHARSFFTELSKYHEVKIRNFSVGDTWKGLSSEPHNDESISGQIKGLLALQTLFDLDGKRSDYPIYGYRGGFNPDVHIILAEMDHYYYYDTYDGYTIAYCVYESTRFPEHFFNQLKKFDKVWVPTTWQCENLIDQGFDPNKIHVVNEGVESDVFYPMEIQPKKDKFQFVHFGRWDYRKSTTEVIRTFGETFKGYDDVEMVCCVENPYPSDGFNTTQQRIDSHNLHYPNVKYIDFLPREEYVKYLREGDVFVSCARSEGWNIPLIESMACGTPSIYSDWGGQLEFAYGKGIPVKISHLRESNIGNKVVEGEYCEPDFVDLSRKMVEVYRNYNQYKKKSILDSKEIRDDFDWGVVTQRAVRILNTVNVSEKTVSINDTECTISFNGQPMVEVVRGRGDFVVEFMDGDDVVYRTTINRGMWAKSTKEYFANWVVRIRNDNTLIENRMSLENRVVFIRFESKSVGDTIAWIPYVEEFRKKHHCKVFCSTYHNDLFSNTYTNINFIPPDQEIDGYDFKYRVGFFVKDWEWDRNKHPNDPKKIPLQKISSDILGVDHIEINPNIGTWNGTDSNMVCIGVHSTAQCKYWNNPNGWSGVVNYLRKGGYEVHLLSNEGGEYMGNKVPEGVILHDNLTLLECKEMLEKSKMFIGVSSGLSWLSWSVGTPTVIISGFTDDYMEPTNGIWRVIDKSVCHGCWHNHQFDPGDWNWCPLRKGTDRMFECTKKITPYDVINRIDEVLRVT